MRISLKICALAAAAALVLTGAGCDKLKARDQLNKGVASYKNARYEQAIEHFKNAVALDPGLQNAKIYLATAYLAQYIPGVDSPENLQNANSAIEQYQAVLKQDPKNVNSVKGIAYLYLQMKKFDDAKKYYRKAVELDRNDPEAYYSLGVIDWTQLYVPMTQERAKEGLKPDEPLKDKKLCASLRERDENIIQEGIDNLNRAIQLRQDYDDAMAYLNLVYRQKADRECDMPEQRAADLKTADSWQDKTLAARQAKAQKQAGAQGVTLEQSQ
jgi:tetratricopeptide (TPR) repeat protein